MMRMPPNNGGGLSAGCAGRARAGQRSSRRGCRCGSDGGATKLQGWRPSESTNTHTHTNKQTNKH
eukprot:1538304-Pyramimonas_sp.AAC.1